MTILASPAMQMIPPLLPLVAATPLPAAPAIGFAGLLAAAMPVSIPAETEAAALSTGEALPTELAPQPADDAAVYLPKGLTPSPAEIVVETAAGVITQDGIAGPGRAPEAGKPMRAASGSPAGRRPLPRALAALDKEASPVAVTRLPLEIGHPGMVKALPQAPVPKVAAGDRAEAVARPPIVDAARPQSTARATPLIVQAGGLHSHAPKAFPSAAVAAPKSRGEAVEIPVAGYTPPTPLPPVTANAVPEIVTAGAPPPFEQRARPADEAVAAVDRDVAVALAPPAPGPERSPGPTSLLIGAPVLRPLAVPDGPAIAPPAALSSRIALDEALPPPPAMPTGFAPALAPKADDRTDDAGLVAALPLLVSAPNGARLPPVRAVPPTRVAGDSAVDRGAVADPGVVAAPQTARRADASGIAPVPPAAASLLPGRIEERQEGRERGPRGDRSVAPHIEAAQRPALALALPLAEIPVAALAAAASAQTNAPNANSGPVALALRDPPAALAMSVASDHLGAVSIGVDDQAGDLRIRLSGSTAAAGAMTAEAPRLIAELAANGLRLGSLDITGSADALIATTASGDGRGGQRSSSGTADGGTLAGSAGGSFAGGAGTSDGRPAGGDRAPAPAASIAAFTRDSVARDQISRPRPMPSDRYA